MAPHVNQQRKFKMAIANPEAIILCDQQKLMTKFHRAVSIYGMNVVTYQQAVVVI